MIGQELCARIRNGTEMIEPDLWNFSHEDHAVDNHTFWEFLFVMVSLSIPSQFKLVGPSRRSSEPGSLWRPKRSERIRSSTTAHFLFRDSLVPFI
jgi:hypothetical protein